MIGAISPVLQTMPKCVRSEESVVQGIALEKLKTPQNFNAFLNRKIPLCEWAPKLTVNQLHIVFRLLGQNQKKELVKYLTLEQTKQIDLESSANPVLMLPLELVIKLKGAGFLLPVDCLTREQLSAIIPFVSFETELSLFIANSEDHFHEFSLEVIGRGFARLDDDKMEAVKRFLKKQHVQKIAENCEVGDVLNVIRRIPTHFLAVFLTRIKHHILEDVVLEFDPRYHDICSTWDQDQVAIGLQIKEIRKLILDSYQYFSDRQIKRTAVLLKAQESLSIYENLPEEKQVVLLCSLEKEILKEVYQLCLKNRSNSPKSTSLNPQIHYLELEFVAINELIDKSDFSCYERVRAFEEKFYEILRMKKNLERHLTLLTSLSTRFDASKRGEFMIEKRAYEEFTERLQKVNPFLLKSRISTKSSLKRKCEAIYLSDQKNIKSIKSDYENLRVVVRSFNITDKEMNAAEISWEDLFENGLKTKIDFERHHIFSITALKTYLNRKKKASEGVNG